MSEAEAQTEAAKAVSQTIDRLCAKSKRCCALCDKFLAGRTPPAGWRGLAWCSQVTFRHPTKKSKKYKLCGECYGELMRREDAK